MNQLKQWIAACSLCLVGSLFALPPKTLVVVLAETRAHELTFENIQRNLLDVTQADLAICIGAKADYDPNNPFDQNAKYRFLYPEPDHYGPAFDEAYDWTVSQNPYNPLRLHWKSFLTMGDTLLGKIKNEIKEHQGSGAIGIFYRWFAMKNILENHLLDQYDFFYFYKK